MSRVYYLIFGISVLIALVLHEGAHAVAIKKKGIEIEEFGLGFPVKFLPQFSFKPKNMPRFRFSLLVLGAYVKHSAEEMEDLPYAGKVEIAGAGVMANFLSFGVFLAIGLLLEADGRGQAERYLLALEASLLAFALWYFRDFFYQLGAQAIGLVGIVLYFVPYTSGTLIDFIRDFLPNGGTMSFGESLILFAAISLNLAFFNLLPLPILDGGHLLVERLEKSFKNGQRIYGCMILLVLFGTLIALLSLLLAQLLRDL